MFEEMIALGVKEFINMGRSGGLRSYGIFLCESSLIEEGTSRHYVSEDPFGRHVYPDEELTARLGDSLKRAGIGFEKAPNWTTDAVFRETMEKATRYRDNGIATVDMEASALFTVAKFRGVKIASAFVVSDVLGKRWESYRHKPFVKDSLTNLTNAVVDCFS
jgi:uridine phosphorylase